MERRLVRIALVLMAWIGISTSQNGNAAETRSTPMPDVRLDCSKPSGDPERYICDSPYLRSLFNLVEDETRRLFGINPKRHSLELEYKAWFVSKIQNGKNYHIHGTLGTYYRETKRAIEATHTALAKRYDDIKINKECVDLPPPIFETLLLNCKVEAVDNLVPSLVGQRQTWTGPVQRDYGVMTITAMALLEAVETAVPQKNPSYRLVWWVDAQGGSIGKPFIVEDQGKIYLTIPVTDEGSAAASSDVVLTRSDPSSSWHEIDTKSWFTELASRLPRGLFPKSAYSLDFLTMRAITDIARSGDPGCCPSGGQAEVGLRLRDDVLVINSLVLKRSIRAPGKARER